MGKFLKILGIAETAIIVLILWLLVIMNFLNVFTRYLLPKYGMAFTEDISMLLFMWLIFFAAAKCYDDDSHLGLSLFYDKFNIRGRMIISILIFFISLVFYGFVFYSTGKLAMNQFKMHVKTGMGFPAVIGGSALPIGSIAIMGQLLKSFIKKIKQLNAEKIRLGE